MTGALVPNGLWHVIEPLLPLTKPKPQGGRPRLPDRPCLRGILFVLRSGIPWEMLPKELGCGSGMTCWRRLRDWQDSGIQQECRFPHCRSVSRRVGSLRFSACPRACSQLFRAGRHLHRQTIGQAFGANNGCPLHVRPVEHGHFLNSGNCVAAELYAREVAQDKS